MCFRNAIITEEVDVAVCDLLKISFGKLPFPYLKANPFPHLSIIMNPEVTDLGLLGAWTCPSSHTQN
jgi:hypothetical protein